MAGIFAKWFKSWQRTAGNPRRKGTTQRQSRGARRLRPQIEALEDRTLLNAGALDATFGVGGKVVTDFARILPGGGNVTNATAIQADGKVVAAGVNYAAAGGDFALVRYNASGGLDGTFGDGGIVTTDFGACWPAGYSASSGDNLMAVAIQPDGKIVAVGSSENGPGPVSRAFAVARYNPDGSLDTTFSGDGLVISTFGGADWDEATSVAIQPDGKILVAGRGFTSGYENTFMVVARYEANGNLDGNFGFGGGWTSVAFDGSATAYAVKCQENGFIVVAGFAQDGDDYDMAMVRLDDGGELNPTFGSGGRVITDFGSVNSYASSLLIQPDGKLVVAGGSDQGATGFDIAVARYNTNGSLDNTFDGDGLLTTNIGDGSNEALSAALQSDGKIVVAGYAEDSVLGGYFGAAVRYQANGAIDTTFGTDGAALFDFGTMMDSTVNAAVIQPDGKIVAAGYATHLGSGVDFAVARLNSNGSLDTSFSTDGKVMTDFPVFVTSDDAARSTVLQPDGKIIVAGSSEQGPTGWDFAVARYNADGSLDASFGTFGRVSIDFGSTIDQVSGVALQADGKVVVVGSSAVLVVVGNSVINESVIAMARLNDDGSLDNTFGTLGRKTIDLPGAYAVAIDGENIIVVGQSATTGFTVLRLQSNGEFDPTFGSAGIATLPPGGGATAVTVQSDHKIVLTGSWFDAIAVMRLTPGGVLDESFGAGGIQAVGLDMHIDFPLFPIQFGINIRFANSLKLDAAGNIVVAGTVTDDNFVYKTAAVVRLIGGDGPQAGMLDETFGVHGRQVIQFGPVMNSTGEAVAVQPDGKIVVAGTGATNFQYFAVGRLNSNGSIDNSFGTAGKVITEFSSNAYSFGVASQPNGDIVLAGYAYNPATSSSDFALARYIGNSAPVAADQALNVAEDSEIDFALAGNDAETPTNQLTFHVTSLTAAGTLYHGLDLVQVGDSYVGVPTLHYVPDPNGGSTSKSFSFSVTDFYGLSDSAEVTFTIDKAVADGGVVLSNGILRIGGTSGSDTIKLTNFTSSFLVVINNGAPSIFTASQVQQIRIWGRTGDDGYTADFGALPAPVNIFDSGAENTLNVNGVTTSNNFIDKTQDGRITWANNAQGTGAQTVFFNGVATVVINPMGGVGYQNVVTDPGTYTIINGGAGVNTYIITATDSAGIDINGGAGSNTYVIELGELAGPVTISNVNPNAIDSVVIIGAVGDNQITVAGNEVTEGTQTIVVNAPLVNLSLNGGTGSNEISIESLTIPVQNLAITANPDDTVTIAEEVTETVATTVSDEGATFGVGALPDLASVNEDGSVVISGLANDYSLEPSAVLTVTEINGVPTVVGHPISTAHGVVALNADGSFTYTPGIGCEADNDSFTYTISDGHGGTATATVTITINHYSGISVVGGILRVGGTAGADTLTVVNGKLRVNGVDQLLAGVTEVRIWGRGGNDQIDLSGLPIKSFIHGGKGNDTLTGGSNDDVIFGGDGDDTITGATGNDLLIGGTGKDRIVGSAGNDILVAGDVECDLNLAALRAISSAWSQSHSATNATVDDILDEVFADGNADQLTGSAGADLFIINSEDKITDYQFGKPNTNKDGDVVILNGSVVS